MPSLLPRSAPRWLTEPVVRGVSAPGAGPPVPAPGAYFLPAGIVVLAASSLDLFDGALARATGQATGFGSVFDAVMDRVSEAAVLFGLLVYFSDRGARTEELLIFAAAVASFLF